jgi:hypothetical protein
MINPMTIGRLRWLTKPDGTRVLQQFMERWSEPTPLDRGYGGQVFKLEPSANTVPTRTHRTKAMNSH